MIFSSKCTIKRLTVRLYLNPLMEEFTAFPRLTGFRGGPVGPRRGKGKSGRESKIGSRTPLLQEITTTGWVICCKSGVTVGARRQFLGETLGYVPGERCKVFKGLLVNVCIRTFIKRKINEQNNVNITFTYTNFFQLSQTLE